MMLQLIISVGWASYETNKNKRGKYKKVQNILTMFLNVSPSVYMLLFQLLSFSRDISMDQTCKSVLEKNIQLYKMYTNVYGFGPDHQRLIKFSYMWNFKGGFIR